jgi:CRISPR-associated protein Cas1
MKKHLNTLYITSPEAYIRKEGMTFIVEIDNKKAFQAPVHTIENIVCFGYKSVTPALMAFCLENRIGISYMSMHGRFLARVYGEQRGSVFLRKFQYEIFDDEEKSVSIARNIIASKVTNSRNLLLRHLRNHNDDLNNEIINNAINSLLRYIPMIENANSLDVLRGYEGESASTYFGVFDCMITSQKEDFKFSGRSKRPPLDEINALLSFVYVLLVNDIRSAIETTGLDPQVGFLHRLRSGRPSLALDIMEEFRAYIADRVVLNLINLKQLNKSDFEKGEIRLSEKGRKEVLIAYQKRKDEVIEHPILCEKTTIGLLPHIQAMFLARYIRKEISDYPPFYIR